MGAQLAKFRWRKSTLSNTDPDSVTVTNPGTQKGSPYVRAGPFQRQRPVAGGAPVVEPVFITVGALRSRWTGIAPLHAVPPSPPVPLPPVAAPPVPVVTPP